MSEGEPLQEARESSPQTSSGAKPIYLGEQLRRSNRASTILRPKTGESFIGAVRRVLAIFGAPDTGLPDIDAMRQRVNIAKHKPGVLVEHFVSIDDYWKTMLDAIEGFWTALAEREALNFDHPLAVRCLRSNGHRQRGVREAL